MPLMMDEEMDMDDLFGDSAGLSIPSRPPSKELYQRVDDLRRSGCCQAIAWSNWGCIATITANGTSVELRNLRCHPENGSWGLSEPTLIPPPMAKTLEGSPLKHLAWSPTGSELAVIDVAGRVTILSIFASLNKPMLHRNCQMDPTDDLSSVVGCFWLNLATYPANRSGSSQIHATKEASTYKYEPAHAPSFGPFHPMNGKSALVCVTTNGLLRIIFPQSTNKYSEAHTELESIVSSDDLITHASICPDKNSTLLITFATASKQLRVVRALVDWGLGKQAGERAGERAPQMPQQLNPSLKTRHTVATSWIHDVSKDTLNASNLESSMTQLSHLEFFPATVDSTGRMGHATIVSARTHLPSSMAHYNQDVQTVVDRWELRDKMQTIHPAFEALSSRRNSVGSPPGPTGFLKKLEGFNVNKVLLTMQSMNVGRVIFFAYSDGSVEYRDRATMAEIFINHDIEHIWHLSQIGFSYTEDQPCLQVALSPTYCSLVQIRNDGKVKWMQMEYLGNIGTSQDDPQYAATVAALALSCATAVIRVGAVNYDDLLATAHKYSNPNFSFDWLIEISRILKITCDYSEEQHYDVLIRNTSIQLILCVQNSLGFRGEFNPRTFPGKFSWLVLQLRNIVVLVSMASNLSVPASPLEDPEVINALGGSFRWVLDFMAWLIDTLLNLPTTLPPNMDLKDVDSFNLSELHAHLRSTNTVSLHLLLCSATRGFLTAMCRRITHLDYIARRAIQTPGTNGNSQNSNPPPISSQLRHAYLHIATLTTKTIIRIKTVETLLSSLTSSIKEVYRANFPSGQSDGRRNAFETKMLFGGQFPECFKSVIVELFKKEGLLEAVRDEIEPAKLFFADFGLLEVGEDEASIRRRRSVGKTMDSFRKVWLNNPVKRVKGGLDGADVGVGNGRQVAKWRRCARCAAVVVDALTERRALQWLIMQQRRCYCSGYWHTLAEGERVA
ncbi:hypothetical protein HYALB_00001718 [Hymenoscyphus albidus]|uniref:Mediator of RNA polymerase II transcription subunit 16 n=1 Tax=Hymenoscyphus albidus TaxID=595503 RepID=A0A9N9Q3N5_9HELO|nr:hypothetical protein HYALB_00001718 [Hymenoscyphus albidus]